MGDIVSFAKRDEFDFEGSRDAILKQDMLNIWLSLVAINGDYISTNGTPEQRANIESEIRKLIGNIISDDGALKVFWRAVMDLQDMCDKQTHGLAIASTVIFFQMNSEEKKIVSLYLTAIGGSFFIRSIRINDIPVGLENITD
jgi:hypothetical protein